MANYYIQNALNGRYFIVADNKYLRDELVRTYPFFLEAKSDDLGAEAKRAALPFAFNDNNKAYYDTIKRFLVNEDSFDKLFSGLRFLKDGQIDAFKEIFNQLGAEIENR